MGGYMYTVLRFQPIFTILSIVFFGNTTILSAQESTAEKRAVSPRLEYAAKFICGKAEGKLLAPGIYFTAINIHNPSDNEITFRKKFAVALPREQPGPVSQFFSVKLGPDQAFEIDCPEIIERIRQRTNLKKGFVIVQSSTALDIVAVYTSAGANGTVDALHIERVPGRSDSGCPDLVVANIEKPTWDNSNQRSVIRATIQNIGTAAATETLARVIDPTTPQPTNAPYNDIATTPALLPGASATVTFELPYWVYNPDVTLEVTADYKMQLPECNEKNNTRIFEDRG